MSPVNPRTELVRYGETNMWSNPPLNMNYQLSFRKISGSLGFVDNFKYMGRHRMTPKKNRYFHVFNLSGTNTGYWNFQSESNRRDPVDYWINLDDLCRLRGIHINVYDETGKIYPRDKCWVLNGFDGLNLLAIERINQFKVLTIDQMYLQCYTVYAPVYHGDAPVATNKKFRYYSREPKSRDHIEELNQKYAEWSREPGLTLIHRNGYLANSLPTTGDVELSEIVEISHDPSVVKVELYELDSFPDFYSKLDKKRKLIVHPPKPAKDDWNYLHFHDTDIYIVNKDGRGVFVNRNNVANVRQITHRDMVISADLIGNLINITPFLNGQKGLKLMVIRKYNRYEHIQVHESNYIRYLYRMDDSNIMGAFTDVKSTMPEWTAAGLESSFTMTLNRSQYLDMTNELVRDAIGYNSLTNVLSNSPLHVTEVGTEIDVGYSFRESATVFEYDKDGLFLGWWVSANRDRIIPKHDKAELIELVPGKASDKLHFEQNDDKVKLTKNWGWLGYVCRRKLPANEPDGEFRLAEEGKDYVIEDGYLVWKINMRTEMGYVAHNDQFVLREFDLEHMDNTLSFGITHEWVGGGVQMPVCPANIVIIMNGRSLINNVDFIMKFPEVQIINKQHIVEGPQSFVVACWGWSPKVTSPINDVELGFVSGGVIGDNGKYNIRENRVTRAIVNGRVMDTNLLDSLETRKSNALLHPLNGYPYEVRHLYMPIQSAKDYDNFYGYVNSRDMDRRASGYLSVNANKPVSETIATQQDKYQVFSPFMSKILNDMRLGLLKVKGATENGGYTKQYLLDTLKDYLWMLEFDPVTLKFTPLYFSVHPISTRQGFALTVDQFIFAKAVNETFLESRCVIENYIEVNHE